MKLLTVRRFLRQLAHLCIGMAKSLSALSMVFILTGCTPILIGAGRSSSVSPTQLSLTGSSVIIQGQCSALSLDSEDSSLAGRAVNVSTSVLLTPSGRAAAGALFFINSLCTHSLTGLTALIAAGKSNAPVYVLAGTVGSLTLDAVDQSELLA